MKHPTPISLKDFRDQLLAIIERVRRGESFLVMKRSTPVFRVMPSEDPEWEIIEDFTKGQRGGIDVSDLLMRL